MQSGAFYCHVLLYRLGRRMPWAVVVGV